MCRRLVIKSFNARLRDELLSETLFTSLAQVRAVLAAWKDDYNNARLRSALGKSHASRVRRSQRPTTALGWSAALYLGLRAPPRCPTDPVGLKCHWDSSHRRMKCGAQTTSSRCWRLQPPRAYSSARAGGSRRHLPPRHRQSSKKLTTHAQMYQLYLRTPVLDLPGPYTRPRQRP
ncbi:integrase core domain-containing protein [Pseudorhodoplanes sp.]|uniref:integrase core domain-containing protein n=1 Tax=Pseudorhodoplanes sp. TaxID=1934341 RepID=UPI003D0A2CA7